MATTVLISDVPPDELPTVKHLLPNPLEPAQAHVQVSGAAKDTEGHWVLLTQSAKRPPIKKTMVKTGKPHWVFFVRLYDGEREFDILLT